MIEMAASLAIILFFPAFGFEQIFGSLAFSIAMGKFNRYCLQNLCVFQETKE
jgi:hypothetical protein